MSGEDDEAWDARARRWQEAVLAWKRAHPIDGEIWFRPDAAENASAEPVKRLPEADLAAAVRGYRWSLQLESDPGRTPAAWFVEASKDARVLDHCRRLVTDHWLPIARSLVTTNMLAIWLDADPGTIERSSPALIQASESAALSTTSVSGASLVRTAQDVLRRLGQAVVDSTPTVESQVVAAAANELAELDAAARTSLPDALVALLAHGGRRSEAPTPPCEFCQQPGGVWRLAFAGLSVSMSGGVGMTYLRELIRRPHSEIDASKLRALQRTEAGRASASTVEPGSWSDSPGVGEQVVDRQALDEYRDEIARLHAEVSDASDRNDDLAVASLQRELEQVSEALRKMQDPRGRPRRRSSRTEKDKAAVGKAIKRAIDRVAASHPALGAHLRASIGNLHTGFPVYHPTEPTPWLT